MKTQSVWRKLLVLTLLVAGLMVACGGGEAEDDSFTVGLIMVGPQEDRGWNQAHLEAAEYVVENLGEGTELITFDKLNVADNPDVTIEQVVDDFVEQGADFIITNSAEFADPTDNAARSHPDVYFIHASGDNAKDGSAPENVSNVMGRMEFGKSMSGCAAAMGTENGKIAYLGPLIDPETRRLVNSTYLGAKHCWENVRGMSTPLEFEVVWIGFWFNIPGFTLDPTQVVNDFIDGGADVIISGIDTTEALVVAGQRADEGILAVPYDYEGACEEAPDVCLGVPFYNWGPDYLELAKAAKDGSWSQQWIWSGPDFDDINNKDTSMIGWVNGPALSADGAAALDAMIAGYSDGSLDLFTGPLNYQDGSTYVAAGSSIDDDTLWYTEQLVEGVVGASAAEE